MPKERPILFNADMVRALLDGRKTHTRRTLKSQPPEGCGMIEVGTFAPIVIDRNGEQQPGPDTFGAFSEDGEWSLKCPYGQPGDRLWVREGFRNRRVDGLAGEVTYKADHPGTKAVPGSYGRPWKPSIHMPRWASRITLEIVSVRVERLQDISEADAQKEGATFTDYGRQCFHYGAPRDVGLCPAPNEHHPQRAGWSMHPTTSHEQCLLTARTAFAHLWGTINGPDNWDANPWVWVVEFKRVEANQ